jgi:hypothetical protein
MTVLELSGKRRAIDLTPARTSSFLSCHQLFLFAPLSLWTIYDNTKQEQEEGEKEEEKEERGRGEEVGGEEEEEEGEGTHLMGVYQIIHDPPCDTTKVHWRND